MNSGKPRLLVLASTFPRWAGDAEPRFVLDLCRGLLRYFDVHALAPHIAGSQRREVLEGVTVHRFRYAPERLETLAYQGGMLSRLRRNPFRALLLPAFLLAMIMAGARLLRAGGFTAIHAHWLVPQGLAAVLIRRMGGRAPCRLVCTSHGGDLFALNGAIWRGLKSWILARCDAVTVVSQAMAAEAAKIRPQDGAVPEVIPMGTDLRDRFTPSETAPRNPDELLFVGRLVEKKGLTHLLDAMAAISSQIPGARLLIAGDGPLRQPLERRAIRTGLGDSVTFLGAVPQSRLPALYRRAAVAVFPFVVARDGDQEGLGLVVIEAMGCGCPVVASDLPAVRDAIKPHATGWLVSPANAKELAETLIQVLHLDIEQRDTVAARARDHVLDRFHWDSVAARYANLLEPGIADAPGPEKPEAAPVVR